MAQILKKSSLFGCDEEAQNSVELAKSLPREHDTMNVTEYFFFRFEKFRSYVQDLANELY